MCINQKVQNNNGKEKVVETITWNISNICCVALAAF